MYEMIVLFKAKSLTIVPIVDGKYISVVFSDPLVVNYSSFHWKVQYEYSNKIKLKSSCCLENMLTVRGLNWQLSLQDNPHPG